MNQKVTVAVKEVIINVIMMVTKVVMTENEVCSSSVTCAGF